VNHPAPTPEVKVSFVNVGFGDCTVLLDKADNQALVMDCPPWGVEAALSALEDCRLDTVIVSHLDLDHYGGITQLMDRVGGCRVFRMAPVASLNNEAKVKIKAFVREVASYLRLDATTGVVLSEGDHGYLGAVRWQCLSPGLLQELEALVSTNNRASVVLRLDLEGTRILVGSDADSVVWRDLIDRMPHELRAEVFRYPHHGSPLAIGSGRAGLDELLHVIEPSHVILSVGERARYRHPRANVIEQLRAAHCRVLCTRSTSLCNNGERSDQPCAGTVSLEWTPTVWSISPTMEKHAVAVEALPTPACRTHVADEEGLDA
jgi:beta-lactamase superfamily II metal-dependent hydrolase